MTEIHWAAQRGFTEAAGSYRRGRPNYPSEIVEWLQSRIGLAPGMTVLELGAGTGKFTQYLAMTGAQVSALEPVHAMRGHLLETVPGVFIVSGSAEAVVSDDHIFDAVVCAQSFHWFSTREVLSEIHRVLKPRGALGLVWNIPDERVSWVAALEAVLRPLEQAAPYAFRRGAWREVFPDERFSDLECTEFQYFHSGSLQRVIIDRVRSLSYIANLPAGEQTAVIERVKSILGGFPEIRGSAEIDFPYRTFAFHCRVKTPEVTV